MNNDKKANIYKYAEYKTTSTISDILNSQAQIFFIDIEDTLLGKNIYYKYAGLPGFNEEFIKICDNLPVNDMLYYGKNYRRTLCEKKAKFVIDKLQFNGKKVFALTSGYPSQQRKARILNLGIHFDGYLPTKGIDKGPYLVTFLKQHLNLNGDCLFIDNDEQKIINVGCYFGDYFGDSRKIDLLLYTRKIEYKISMESFIEYWKNVAKFAQKERKILI